MIFHWDMAIYWFSIWRPSAILKLFYYHTIPPIRSLCCWQQLPVKFHVNLIHRSEDIAIWIFRIFGLKCLFRPQNGGFGGLRIPKCDYPSSRPPKGTSMCKSSSFKLAVNCKIRWGVWPVGALTESACDGHTHTHARARARAHTQVNLYYVDAWHWTDKNSSWTETWDNSGSGHCMAGSYARHASFSHYNTLF